MCIVLHLLAVTMLTRVHTFTQIRLKSLFFVEKVHLMWGQASSQQYFSQVRSNTKPQPLKQKRVLLREFWYNKSYLHIQQLQEVSSS